MEHVYLLTGSNLGNRQHQLEQAQQQLVTRCGVLVAQSGVYQTAAWGKEDQPDFLNQVLVLATHLLPHNLLSTLLAIEQQLGRQRKEKWGERSIDIDILYYGNNVIDTELLVVPHPHLQNRKFALEPLCEVAPEFVHPVLHKTNKELLAECSDTLLVTRL